MIAVAPMDPETVAALVLTFRRPRLATMTVRGLVEKEGLTSERVLLVVNGEGGLDDEELERSIHVLRLPANLGPAGGYRRGMEWIRERLDVRWVYLCEDDIALFDLPSPRLATLVPRVESLAARASTAAPVGAVVAFGRDQSRWTGATVPHVPGRDSAGFDEVSVAAWGASLVSMDVVASGILPDEAMFFGFEDFDFWMRMRQAGYRLLVDAAATRTIGEAASSEGRTAAHAGARPLDSDEPWRRYYEARNFLVLRRRYGHIGWTLAHLVKTARRVQRSPTWAARKAAMHGLADGFRGVTGMRPGFSRDRGELV